MRSADSMSQVTPLPRPPSGSISPPSPNAKQTHTPRHTLAPARSRVNPTSVCYTPPAPGTGPLRCHKINRTSEEETRLLCLRISHVPVNLASMNSVIYSGHYVDGCYEYRHITLTDEIVSRLPVSRLVTEAELLSLGVQQSRGWTHYTVHRPEPNILLFRRALGTDPATGVVDPVRLRAAQQAFVHQLSRDHH